MTLRNYAKERGISLSAVQDRIKNGSITDKSFVVDNGKRLIVSELADEEFKKNANPAQLVRTAAIHNKDIKQMTGENLTLPTGKNIVEKPVNSGDKPVEVTKVPLQEDDFDRFKKAKASTEELRSEKLELEVAEMRGRLVDLDLVKTRITKLVGTAREVLLNVPGKVGPELFACESLIEVENRLRDEINAALDQLQRMNFDDFGTSSKTDKAN